MPPRGTLTGSTPDVVEFDLAVQAGMRGDREQAEQQWRTCLACGEMKAHYGLGYTLIELGRPREAFGHLAMYTEICPRNAWAWAFRGRAAHRMGETAEARLSYQVALGYEAAGSTETNAAIWLAELDAETADKTGATVTTIFPQTPATVTARFTEALEYARAHHADQRRKGTTIPYLAHLLAVSALVLEHGGSETAAIAALLHDVVEDGGGEPASRRSTCGSGRGRRDRRRLQRHDGQGQGGLDARQAALPLASRSGRAGCPARFVRRQAAQLARDPFGPARARRRPLGQVQLRRARAAVVLRSAARRVPASAAWPAGQRTRSHRARDRAPPRPAGPGRVARPAL